MTSSQIIYMFYTSIITRLTRKVTNLKKKNFFECGQNILCYVHSHLLSLYWHESVWNFKILKWEFS